MLTPNAIQNLAWLAVSLALGRGFYRLSPRTSWVRRTTALVLLAVALFPIVSVTDDLLRAAYLSSFFDTRRNAGSTVPDENGNGSPSVQLQLIRAFDASETAQVSPCVSFHQTLVAAEWTLPHAAHSHERAPITVLGRAPPIA